MSDSIPIGIIGAGRVGRALAALLGRNHTVRITSRQEISELTRACPRVIIAVPDSEITEVAMTLAHSDVQTVLHTCGSQGPSALEPLPSQGVSCATFHPLQTFATVESGIERLPGSSFGICGTGAALEWAQELCNEFNGTPIVIAEDLLPLYHAAAVMAGNYSVGLIDVAVSLMESAGVERPQALTAIAPLVRASAENALIMGPEAALTGPIDRGDLQTVEGHLESLHSGPVVIDDIYRAVGRQLIAIARRRGLSDEKASQFVQLLSLRNYSS